MEKFIEQIKTSLSDLDPNAKKIFYNHGYECHLTPLEIIEQMDTMLITIEQLGVIQRQLSSCLSEKEIHSLQSEQSSIEEVDTVPEGTRKLEQEQLIGKSKVQVEREQKDKEAEQMTKQQTKEFKEATSDKANQTLSKKSIRNGYIDSAIDGNEIQNGQQSLKEEINERKEMKKLQFLGGNRTPEQERRFQELQHIYQTNQQQIRRQSKDNGMNR